MLRITDFISWSNRGGREGAKAFWEAGSAAIDEIFRIAQTERIECELKWVPGYLHGQLGKENRADRESLQKDAELARELGFKAEFVERVPYAFRPGVKFEGQAKFHPLKYLGPLLERIPGAGSYVFENTEASEIDAEPLTVHAGRYKIRCSYLVL